MIEDIKKKIWAYLHNEIDCDQAGAVESSLDQDASLCKEFRETQSLDTNLRELVPIMYSSDKSLEQRILSLWEEDSSKDSVAENLDVEVPSATLQ